MYFLLFNSSYLNFYLINLSNVKEVAPFLNAFVELMLFVFEKMI